MVWWDRDRLDRCLFWGVTTGVDVEWKNGFRRLYVYNIQKKICRDGI